MEFHVELSYPSLLNSNFEKNPPLDFHFNQKVRSQTKTCAIYLKKNPDSTPVGWHLTGSRARKWHEKGGEIDKMEWKMIHDLKRNF